VPLNVSNTRTPTRTVRRFGQDLPAWNDTPESAEFRAEKQRLGLTLAECARRLGCTPNEVYRLIAGGIAFGLTEAKTLLGRPRGRS